jgi:hypothetical protein
MDCQKRIAEKCPDCGRATELEFQVGETWQFSCVNLDCRRIFFPEGAGGISHGLCRECAAVRNLQMEVADTQGLNYGKFHAGEARHISGRLL